MPVVLPNGRNQFDGLAGAPAVGYKLYTYVPNTTTLKDTYTTALGNVANQNPVVMDSRGEAAIYWLGAYDVTLKTPADVTVWGPERLEQFATDSDLDTFVSDIADTSNVSKGDALVGVKQPFGGAVARTQHSKNSDVLHVKDFGVVGDDSNDDTVALQEAITASAGRTLRISGIIKITAKIIMPTLIHVIGEDHVATQIHGTHSGVIFEFPINNVGCEVANIYFRGIACTGITTDLVATGALQGYLNQVNLHHCDFGYEMAFGVNSSMLCCSLYQCTFGYRGTGSVGDMVGVKSYATGGAQNTNLNFFRECVFNNCATTAGIAFDAFGGVKIVLEACDFEGCGRAIRLSSISQAEIKDCWFERNVTTATSIIVQEECYLPLVIENCVIINNTLGGNLSLIETGSVSCAGVIMRNNLFGLNTGQFVFYDNLNTTHALLANGSIQWHDNKVTGGDATNTLLTGINRNGTDTVRGWANISTTTPTLQACSDALAFVTKNATGDVTLTLTNPMGSAATSICAVASSNDSLDVQVQATATDTSHIRVYARKAAAGFDCIVSVMWSSS